MIRLFDLVLASLAILSVMLHARGRARPKNAVARGKDTAAEATRRVAALVTRVFILLTLVRAALFLSGVTG